MNKRVFLIVLDSLGIGELPDSCKFGDENSNTLKAISKSKFFKCDNLKRLGLFNIDGVQGGISCPTASYARLAEKSAGKDTTVGHWEIAGLISNSKMPTYPNGFPTSVIKKFEKLTGRKVICNKPYSGTEVIKDYGEEHLKSGNLIVYTSADSVFQIASHDKVVPLNDLYRCCEIARQLLKGKHGVGRVIARPFTGEYPFVRTAYRRDYSILPYKNTMLNLLSKASYEVISVGKIYDIFAGKGITTSYKTISNDDGINKTIEILKRDFSGLCFVNLVDFDAKYGHRNDVDGYAKALSEFDKKLSLITNNLAKNDLLFITADHGCDPSTISTDHSREYVPLLVYGDNIIKNVNLKTRNSFSDISATILEYFNVDKEDTDGESFLKSIIK
ncbi:MAG: phosphopentomutase [Clostridia bacterium]|nr:phosphopentomutase [Clostridia bacterium]